MLSNVPQPVQSQRQKPNSMVLRSKKRKATNIETSNDIDDIDFHMIPRPHIKRNSSRYRPSIESMESLSYNRNKENCSLCRGDNCNDPHCGQSNSPTPIANTNKINN